jgi:formate hydrogenlyase subunit 3/multisubunit Na+/H+ antiporter MnhD subunit
MQPATPLPMSLVVTVAALLLPLLAFGVIMVATRSRHRLSAAISIGAAGLSLLAAVTLLVQHWQMTAPLVFQTVWMVSGQMAIPLGILLDPTSLLMFTVVAAISLLVQLYSLGYMAGDPGFGRYYGCMSLFAWAMLTMTVSSSLLQLYIFWELVGLASYLLIGFWFDKFSASEAGKKAFVMTRTGDVAFLLGLVLLWLQLGTLDIPVLTDPAAVGKQLSPGMITLTALLIFGGIVGKSAQFPLLTWLPDAMEGPTPVSALLHSATMVAAGVYLFARLFGFFSLSPTAMTVCLTIGTISMLLASTMAMVARDIKQVWAYSTISQLGFMLMGLGAGSLFAGVFHLVTHAGFKALLFLSRRCLHSSVPHQRYVRHRPAGRAPAHVRGGLHDRGGGGAVRAAAVFRVLQQRTDPGAPAGQRPSGRLSGGCGGRFSDHLLLVSVDLHPSASPGCRRGPASGRKQRSPQPRRRASHECGVVESGGRHHRSWIFSDAASGIPGPHRRRGRGGGPPWLAARGRLPAGRGRHRPGLVRIRPTEGQPDWLGGANSPAG